MYCCIVDETNEYDDLFFTEEKNIKLTEHEQKECDGLLTEAECFASLKTMTSNKTPGSDGLPLEFYKVFWKGISQYLLKALNTSYANGCLSVTQKRGLMTLIPKKNKDAKLLKNWRPVTLLNCDYKIASKSIANRLNKLLPKLIDYDQTGFQKNRFIGENIRLIDSIITYAREKNLPGLLLFVDFEKAFDSLEWTFIEKTLAHFKFGPSLIAWIKLFYTDIASCVQNNGWASEFFSLNRGVRQGCPLSSYLFLLCVEVLGSTIRNDKQIKGIEVMNSECKISQYADDTTLILDGSNASAFSRSIFVLDAFASISGLCVNYEKMECLWIGSRSSSTDIYPSEKPIKLANKKVYALGTWFSTVNEHMQINFSDRFEKMKKILNSWSARRLTLLGKIAIIKSLAISQIVYALSSLPTPKGLLKDINSLLYEFLWEGKGDKVKRTQIINKYDEGGLKMVDIESFSKALKAKWVVNYLNGDTHGKWKLFFDYYLQKHGGKALFQGNLNSEDVPLLKLHNAFIEEIVQIWSHINYTADEEQDFGNSCI